MRGLVKRDPVVPSLSLGFRQSPSGRLRTPQELHLHSSFGWWGRTTLLPEFCSDFLKRLSFGLWNFKKCKQGEGQDDPSEEEEHVRPAEIRDVLEAERDNEIAKPVAEGGQGQSSGAGSLAEKFSNHEPRDWTWSDLKETDEEENGCHAHVTHPGEFVQQHEAHGHEDGTEKHPNHSS